ncbi:MULTISPECIES: YbeF family protein [unclassified Bacillus (in: firmicutes)]|uniref:YbeF family protein n=1 Tax=unclassified Bacillus (in: firmicutes) TaxID=185979 RepID=UPI00228185F5|nr:YbeF family protein [Bacillus sp. S20C3]MCY8202042.1 YbeF family protein [Bacillus sp. N12A5]MCY8287477.1 YbeF family protein [Bacillus sp. N13C7]MCY8638692.1 YbeF family protein [Bacillus sp. S17B2]MCY8718806.1 YbeF family protein [Bacillus sp. S10C12M]MCY9144594.1 YbeF family protein [Bacillus sp. T9C1]
MDELDIAYGILPLSIILFSIAGTCVCKNVYLMPMLSFIISLVLTFTIFNASFLGWAVVYSLFSLALSYITLSVARKKKASGK